MKWSGRSVGQVCSFCEWNCGYIWGFWDPLSIFSAIIPAWHFFVIWKEPSWGYPPHHGTLYRQIRTQILNTVVGIISRMKEQQGKMHPLRCIRSCIHSVIMYGWCPTERALFSTRSPSHSLGFLLSHIHLLAKASGSRFVSGPAIVSVVSTNPLQLTIVANNHQEHQPIVMLNHNHNNGNNLGPCCTHLCIPNEKSLTS